MAKNYTININYLEQLLDMFAGYTSDADVKDDYLRTKDYIERLKSGYTTTSSDTPLLERLDIDYGTLSFYKPYYPFTSKLAKSKYQVQDFESKKRYQKLDISPDEILDLLKDFFKEQGLFFYEQFLEFLDEVENHLEFVEPNDHMDGEMLFLSTIGEAFVSVADYPNICKLTIASHEFTHVTDCYNNPNFYRQYLVREISTVFMEIIASDYLSERLNLGNDNIKRRAYLHSIIKAKAQDIIRKTQMLTKYGKYKNLKSKDLMVNLRNEGFSKTEITKLEEECLIENYFYVIAQLTAIELYFIYKKDKEKALSILEDIVMNANDYNILDILSNHGIVLASKLNAYEEELIKGLKNR